MYTWSVDIWALGAVVHQVLTSETPFLEIDEISDDSTYDTMQSSIDGELLLNYCAGRCAFPVASLTSHGASADAVDFVKSLMVPNPNDRLSAASALQSVWLIDVASQEFSDLETHLPGQISVNESAVRGTEVPGRAYAPQPMPNSSLLSLITVGNPLPRAATFSSRPPSTRSQLDNTGDESPTTPQLRTPVMEIRSGLMNRPASSLSNRREPGLIFILSISLPVGHLID